MLPISVIVLTYNEAQNIEACLDSLLDWAGEIFVVDSGSTDRTLDLVAGYPISVFTHPFENYSQQRNWAQQELPLRYDWVFHIDADERVTNELINGLRQVFADEQRIARISGLFVRRRIVFWGKHIRHGGIYPTYHCRIFRSQVGQCEDREYDQHFVVQGHTERLEADLTEMTASSLFSWTARHNRWAQMEALHLIKNAEPKRNDAATLQPNIVGSPAERRRWLRASVYERAPVFLRALAYFITRYILRGGFLDGTPGLVYHVLHGFWFRFYVDACLYEAKHIQKPAS
jgi:glycosyltransferase involved in cell wall biosynthesis